MTIYTGRDARAYARRRCASAPNTVGAALDEVARRGDNAFRDGDWRGAARYWRAAGLVDAADGLERVMGVRE